MKNPEAWVYFRPMVTILREDGLRFVIYPDDHEPAHVHVYGDGEARIDIVRMIAMSQRGMKKRDLAKALAIVREKRELFWNRWSEIHG